VISEAALLVVVAPGHDIEQEPSAGDALEGGRHLGRQGRGGEAGPESHQEPEPLGHLGERRSHHPGVLTPAAGRGERGIEPELLGGAGDLADVADVGHALATPLAGAAADHADGVAETEVRTRVSVRGQKPMELYGHEIRMLG